MKVIGKSEDFGPVVQCEKCHTVWHLNRHATCPTCWLKQRTDHTGKKRRGRPKKNEGWISIGGK